MKIQCFSCKHQWEFEAKTVSRREECPSCYASLHSCKMCNYYDKSAYNECRESSADRITEKEKSNFCDFYALKSEISSALSPQDEAKKAAEALFKKN